MTNEQIIIQIAESVFGEDTVISMIENGEDIPLHTLQRWNDKGFRVKKGEHGLETRLWKKRKKKASSDAEEESASEEPANRNFYMARAYLYRGDQVCKIKGE